MARMSDPQMVEAFMASRTWQGPGSGSGRSRISVVELPGRKTPRMPGPRLLCSLADEGGRSDPLALSDHPRTDQEVLDPPGQESTSEGQREITSRPGWLPASWWRYQRSCCDRTARRCRCW